MKLDRSFYARPTLDVARELLGKVLVRGDGTSNARGKLLQGRIAETEAYFGFEDRASHAARGRTPRNAIMFGPAGYCYVYLIYGMHHCLNFVTESEGFPAAVLIRGLEPIHEPRVAMNGPGRLCRAFGLDRAHNGVDLCGNELWVEDAGTPAPAIVCAPRVGVDYAGECAAWPWRFFTEGSPAATRTKRRSAQAEPDEMNEPAKAHEQKAARPPRSR